MSDKSLVVLFTFLVAITPSLSDMVQVNDVRPGAWVWVVIWYVLLLFFISGLWEKI
jgi:hypothetical protein